VTATVDVPVALDVLGRASYVLLTTFRKTGAPVPTPVWVVRSGDELLVWSNPAAGKIKRIRNSGRVELAPCTGRGKPLGRSIDGQARLLPDEETRSMLRLLVRKYGARGFFSTLGPRYFGVGSAGIGITVPAGE
jgi:PPOX class probable F420-dependent enzyme